MLKNLWYSNNKKFFFSISGSSIEGAPSWLPKADFSRTQSDLIATSPEGEQAVFIDYFTNFDLPSIQTDNGLLFKGTLLKALAGPMAPGQYAQAAGDGALSIGEVSSVTGTVKATRLDGNVFDLSTGDPVFQGDTIETVGSGFRYFTVPNISKHRCDRCRDRWSGQECNCHCLRYC